MKKLLLFIPFLALSIGFVYAQEDDLPAPSSHPTWRDSTELPGRDGYFLHGKNKTDLSDYIIEPDLMLSMGYGSVNVGFSPTVGYRVWKNLFVGGNLTYLLTDFHNIGYQDVTGSTHYVDAYWNTFGAGVFLQYKVWRGLFVRNRFDVMERIMDDVYDASAQLDPQTNAYHVVMPKINKTIPDDLLGIGYNLMEGRNFFLPLMFSYNLLHSATNRAYAVYPRGYELQLGFVQIF